MNFRGFKFLCLFRPKIWWMVLQVGQSANEIPIETQMLLIELQEGCAFDDGLMSPETKSTSTFYILMLPVLEGPFRTSLQGSSANELQFCIESGQFPVNFDDASTAYSKSTFCFESVGLLIWILFSLMLQEMKTCGQLRCWRQCS